MSTTDAIRSYHERTKHRLGAYARGPEYLDWEHQPDPFRRFAGTPLQPLPLSAGRDPQPATNGDTAALDLAAIGRLLELSMGLSAWKAYGPERWALRCNPSSGNLHPTEAYLVSNGVAGLEDGIHHYAPREHALERRARLQASEGPPFCLLGLSSILWREAWKYGERAFRYVQLDVGHALGAVRYAAAVLGWGAELLPVGDRRIEELLGLDRSADFAHAEGETPDLLLRLLPTADAPLAELPTGCDWLGQANALSGEPRVRWPVAEQAHAASPCAPGGQADSVTVAAPPADRDALAALIRQRRSAQSFIARESTLHVDAFERLLRAMLPDPRHLPWDCWPQPPRVHPLLFVHRVEGIEPGLFALARYAGAEEYLQAAMSPEFMWKPVEQLAGDIPLYRLASGDIRKVARTLSCHQEIASASAFSLSMLAEYDEALQQGPCAYRHLHWEAGLIGQALYLEAEAVGMRGTGIGCFFDDAVHEGLGIADTRLQSVYHFTVGKPQLDIRLQTLPPYEHLERNG